MERLQHYYLHSYYLSLIKVLVVQVDLPLGRQPAILRLEGAAVQCQLELRAPAGFGFYVFIDTLHIQNTPACSGDFLQFGRWITQPAFFMMLNW